MIQSLFPDRTDRRILTAYIIWEVCNLIAIQWSYRACSYTDQCRIMYLAICVNTVLVVYFYMKYGARIRSVHNVLALGLIFTAAADYFLTLRVAVLPGYLLFCVVEAIYALYYKPTVRNIMVRAALYAAALALIYAIGRFTFINALGILNLSLLTVNVVCAWLHYRKSLCSWSHFLAIGFTLFAGCDYSILIWELASDPLSSIFNHMIWIFYVPAQVMLVLGYALAVSLSL